MAEWTGDGTATSSSEVYATRVALKARLRIDGDDTSQDDLLNFLLEVASRAIDDWTHRVFYQTTAGTRYFDGYDPVSLEIDDLITLTSLTTDSEQDGTFDGETWVQGVTEDFYLWPQNQTPKTRVKATPDGDYRFANLANYVKIVGDWGYAEAPSRIVNACLLLAAQEYEGQGGENYQSEGLGDYRYRVATGIDRNDQAMRLLGAYRKLI